MESVRGDELIHDGWMALDRADWASARSLFEQARAAGDRAEALDGLGRALHFQCDYEQAIELTERAFAAYRLEGRPVDAADRARWLAFLHGAIHGNMAAASGWLGRAASLIEDVEECAAHGWLSLDQAPLSDDAAERHSLATAALAIARRYGDVDLEFDALSLLGESCVASGRVREGMQLLDQAMTAVLAGEVTGVVAVSDIFCRLLNACEISLDVVRAEQWLDAAGRFGTWSEFVSPVCRSHYGGLLVSIGRWPEAEQQLLDALRAFERGYRGMAGLSIGRLADLRVRQGRFDEARRLTEGFETHPDARRLLAVIALARGDAALAEELASLSLESRRPTHPQSACVLELIVEVRLARGNVAGAVETCERLTSLAEVTGDEAAAAFAERGTGRILAARLDATASAHLQDALQRFAALKLPLEAARAQLELARCLAERSPEAAVGEARLALGAFERIGAAADADAAGALLRGLGAGGRTFPKHHGELTKRETEVLALLADGCSNEEIARRLVISRRTAEHHVAHIMSKLGLRSRAEAAAYAVRIGVEDR